MTTFAQLEISEQHGLPVYLVDESGHIDSSRPRLKIDNTQFIHLAGSTIGNRADEGQSREVVLVGYFRVGAGFVAA